MQFQDTKNELEIHFECSQAVRLAIIQPLGEPHEFIQCFSEGGPCEEHEGGFWTFDVPDANSGILFIRSNGDLPHEGELMGDFVFADGFESGNLSSWSHPLP